MRFEKWQALGNDYLIFERRELAFELTPARVRRICTAHFGVHADGILLLGPSEEHVAELEIFNPDGSVAELSGNGAREAVLYLRRRGWTEQDTFSILTKAGVIRPTVTGPFSARVDMGKAALSSKDFPDGAADGTGLLQLEGAGAGDGGVHFRHVSIGNPQAAIRVEALEDLEVLDLKRLGPAIEAHAAFPNRTNVSWYTQLAAGPPTRVRARIFERGVGETASSGTGATGAAIACLLDGESQSWPPTDGPAQVEVVLDGGELLVEVDANMNVHLSGWALPVFSGRLSDQFLEELRELA
jgi:diaminopimelate epimerase